MLRASTLCKKTLSRRTKLGPLVCIVCIMLSYAVRGSREFKASADRSTIISSLKSFFHVGMKWLPTLFNAPPEPLLKAETSSPASSKRGRRSNCEFAKAAVAAESFVYRPESRASFVN